MLGLGMPGWSEMLIIGIIAVLLFGTRLPKIARSVGSSLVEFKKGMNDLTEGAEEIKKDIENV